MLNVSGNLKPHQLTLRISTYIVILFISVHSYGQRLSARQYNSFSDFYSKLSDNKYLKFTNLPFVDVGTQTKNIGEDSVQETLSLKFTDLDLKFIVNKKIGGSDSDFGSSCIFYNNQKILPDTNNGFEGLKVTSAAKSELNGISFLVLFCVVPDCNGNFCRVEYDQLFQINGKEITHQIIEGWQFPANIYCDLNNDGQLDLISFVGDCLSKNDTIETKNPEKYYFCIQAKTLVNNNWVGLTDENKKPYYIYLQVDDFFELETFKVIDYNWMTVL